MFNKFVEDKQTHALVEFNDFVMRDERTEKVMLLIIDGLLMVTYRREGQVTEGAKGRVEGAE